MLLRKLMMIFHFLKLQIKIQLMLLKLVYCIKLVNSPRSYYQRINQNQKLVKFEVSHLKLRLLHLFFNNFFFKLKLFFDFHLFLFLFFCHTLFFDLLFISFDLILHFFDFFLVLFGLLVYLIFGFHNFLDAQRRSGVCI